jgi:hypothetical protein
MGSRLRVEAGDILDREAEDVRDAEGDLERGEYLPALVALIV